MADPSRGAFVVDAYRKLRAVKDMPLDRLLHELLGDVRRFAAQRGVDLDRAPQSVHGRVFAVGDGVEREPARESAAPRRGYVTALDIAEPGHYLVRFPGGGVVREPAERLRGAPDFPPVQLDGVHVRTAADAERQLVVISARIRRSTNAKKAPDRRDVERRARLCRALAAWSGVGGEQILFNLNPNIVEVLGARGAARDFPNRPALPSPARPRRPMDGRPSGPPRSPRR